MRMSHWVLAAFSRNLLLRMGMIEKWTKWLPKDPPICQAAKLPIPSKRMMNSIALTDDVQLSATYQVNCEKAGLLIG